MRRVVPLALAGLATVLTLTGCGAGEPVAVHDPAASTSASPTWSASPVATATSTPAPSTDPPNAGPDIPDDLPLGAGLHEDGETTVDGPGRDVEGAYLEDLCGFTGWPGPMAHRVDRLAARQSGPEFLVVRELVTYDSEDSAAAVLEGLRDQVGRCPATRGQDVTPYDAGTDEDTVTYAMTYRRGLGGLLVQVTRLGRALLAVTWSGEYSRDSAAEAMAGLTRVDQRLIERLGCSWDQGRCAS